MSELYPSFYIKESPRARKQHRCSECDGTIEPGETYEKITGCWDGDVCTYKTCLNCQTIRDNYNIGKRIEDQIWLSDLFEYLSEIGNQKLSEAFNKNAEKRGSKLRVELK